MEASSEEIDKSKLVISPISEPMASDKLTVKTIGLVSKLAKVKLIKRGVKEKLIWSWPWSMLFIYYNKMC